MSVLNPDRGPHPVHTFHRAGATLIGAGLMALGALGFTRAVSLASITDATDILGLSCNGLLSVISLAVGGILVAAAIRGGPAASAALVLIGSLFLASGIGHLFLLDSSYNVLAFGASNIAFSLTMGLVLTPVGAYGRLSAALPPDNPYATAIPTDLDGRSEPAARGSAWGAAAAELARAERQAAIRRASDEQLRRLAVTGQFRAEDDRLDAWVRSAHPGGRHHRTSPVAQH